MTENQGSANLPEKTDWSTVEGAVDKPGEVLPEVVTGTGSGGLEIVEQRFGTPNGVVAKYKSNQIQRRAALSAMEQYYDGQLAVITTEITEAVKVRQAETVARAEKFLARLDEERLDYLRELGMRNVGSRQRALVELGEQTATILKEVQEKDWPQSMLEDTIQGILELRVRFFGKITAEFGAVESDD